MPDWSTQYKADSWRPRLSDSEPALLAKNARASILKMVHAAKAAHVGSCLSVVDILATVYCLPDVDAVEKGETSQVILSKGHAAAAIYAVLAHRGYFPEEWLDRYAKDGAELGGHATSGVPGIQFSTGSLGHGLPFGLGLAMGRKLSGQSGNVYVVMSDGELNEGTTWESALLAAHHNLDNLIVLVDRNGLQSLTSTESTLALNPLPEKFESFGWAVASVDGHNHEEIRDKIMESPRLGKPKVLICQTTKGKGISFMENKVVWHYRSPDDDNLAAALAEIERS